MSARPSTKSRTRSDRSRRSRRPDMAARGERGRLVAPLRNGKPGPPAIIVKKVKKVGHAGHHGGAWKVAYADFVTAMMAFFLLLWLLNVTTDVQKRGIADYFEPTISWKQETSGAGGLLG